MADAVVTRTVFNGPKFITVQLMCVSDGTGETNVTKIDKSTLVNGNQIEPSQLMLRDAQWSIQGFTSVRLSYDHATDDPLLNMAVGNGFRQNIGGNTDDPQPGVTTGDILLTSVGAVNQATYDLYLRFEKAQNAV